MAPKGLQQALYSFPVVQNEEPPARMTVFEPQQPGSSRHGVAGSSSGAASEMATKGFPVDDNGGMLQDLPTPDLYWDIPSRRVAAQEAADGPEGIPLPVQVVHGGRPAHVAWGNQVPASAGAGAQPDADEEVPPALKAARECAEVGLGLGGFTTVMIRHVPPHLTQWSLMEELNRRGFAEQFDFIYVPVDARKKANRGIAFVNFSGCRPAYEFYRLQHGQPWDVSSDKATVVMPADVQGFEANAQRFAVERNQLTAKLNPPLLLRPGSQPAAAAPPRAAGRARPAAGSSSSSTAGACRTCGQARLLGGGSFCGFCGSRLA